MRVLCLSGNFTRPSRTLTLAKTIADEFSRADGWQVEIFDMIDAGPNLGTSTSRENASQPHLKMWDAVRDCDALVVASPIYKASYSGLLKHFLDLLEMDLLVGKPVLLGATGKAAQHALMIDHQFRPLFAFFRAVCIPTSLFALDGDFVSPAELTVAMKDKVRVAAAELKHFTSMMSDTPH